MEKCSLALEDEDLRGSGPRRKRAVRKTKAPPPSESEEKRLAVRKTKGPPPSESEEKRLQFYPAHTPYSLESYEHFGKLADLMTRNDSVFPEYHEDFENYTALKFLYYVCRQSAILNNQVSFHLSHEAIVNELIVKYAETQLGILRDLKNKISIEVKGQSWNGKVSYEALLTFQKFSTTLQEFLLRLRTCGLFNVPEVAWPLVSTSIFDEGSEICFSWTLRHILGHPLVRANLEPEIINYLAMVDAMRSADSGDIVAPMNLCDGFIPRNNLPGICIPQNDSQPTFFNGGVSILVDERTKLSTILKSPSLESFQISQFVNRLQLCTSELFGVRPLVGFTSIDQIVGVDRNGEALYPEWDYPTGAVYPIFGMYGLHHVKWSSLAQLFISPAPPTKIRLSIAIRIASQVQHLASVGWTHGDLTSDNIMMPISQDDGEIHVSYSCFRGFRLGSPWPRRNIRVYRKRISDGATNDIDCLGWIMLEVFLWRELGGVFEVHSQLMNFVSEVLEARFARVILSCFRMNIYEEIGGYNVIKPMTSFKGSQGFYRSVLRPLQKCLNEEEGWPTQDNNDWGMQVLEEFWLEAERRPLLHQQYLENYLLSDPNSPKADENDRNIDEITYDITLATKRWRTKNLATVQHELALANEYKLQKEFGLALHSYQVAHSDFKKILGKTNDFTLKTVEHIAAILTETEQYIQALELHERTLDDIKIAPEQSGRDKVMFKTINDMAEIHTKMKHYDQAIEGHTQALGWREQHLGRDHPDTVRSTLGVRIAMDLKEKELKEKEEASAATTLDVPPSTSFWPVAVRKPSFLSGLRAFSSSRPSTPDPVAIDKTEPVEASPPEIDTVTKIDPPLSEKPPLLTPRPEKRKIYPVHSSPETLHQWTTTILPRLEKLLTKLPAKSLSIDLLGIGTSRESSRPTIVITVDGRDTPTVRTLLKKKFKYDTNLFDLKVRKGGVQRSLHQRTRTKHTRGMSDSGSAVSSYVEFNREYQQKPLSGASIGATRDGQDLPPGTFGGVVEVDGKVYGMTVHHLLDPLSDVEEDEEQGDEERVEHSEEEFISDSDEDEQDARTWSSGGAGVSIASWESDSEYSLCSEADDMFVLSLNSDSESESDLDDSASVVSDTGDIPGLPLDHLENLTIYQPAPYDSPAATPLGTVLASSGLRRARQGGVLHEIDWALITPEPSRLVPHNVIRGGSLFYSNINNSLTSPPSFPTVANTDTRPQSIVPAHELAEKRVHASGRTTGLQGGVISPAMSALRLPGRRSFSRSWHVVGNLGVPGDSGSWVVENGSGGVVGVVVAKSREGGVTYIAPMQILVDDIHEVLKRVVGLPGVVTGAVIGKPAKEKVDKAKRTAVVEEVAGDKFVLGELNNMIRNKEVGVDIERELKALCKAAPGPAPGVGGVRVAGGSGVGETLAAGIA